MRKLRILGLVLAAFGTFAGGACNFLLGLADGPPGAGGSAGTGSGGGDGGMGPDADAGLDAAPPGRGIWSKSFGASTVAAIAVDASGDVFITGKATSPKAFDCPVADAGADAGDAGAETGTGYLVELDSKGNCTWGFFFGDTAQGTGVAVDGAGNIALTGSFTGTATIEAGYPLTAIGTDSFVALFDAGSGHPLRWTAQLGEDGTATGNRITTAVALNDSTLVVAGSYTGSLGVTYPTGSPAMKPLAGSSDAADAFLISFDATLKLATYELLITSPAHMNATQFTNGVAQDSSGNVAAVGTATGPTLFGSQTTPTMASTAGNIFVTASDSNNGQLKVSTLLGGSEAQIGSCVALDPQGNILVGGTFYGTIGVGGQGADAGSYVAKGGTSVLLAQYSLTGTPLASLQLGSDTMSDDATIAGIALYSDMSVTFAGGFEGAAHFTDGTTVTTANGKSAVYVAKVDGALSKVSWVERYGNGVQSQAADAVAVDPTGNILVAGHFQGTLDFGKPTAALVNPTVGTNQIFVAKLAP